MKSKLIVLLILLSVGLFAVNEETGTTGFSFLKVQYSARASALAHAYSGLANDAYAAFYNPAGLAQVQTQSVTTTYNNHFEGMHGGALIYAHPINQRLTIAPFVQNLYGKETRTLVDPQGNFAGTDGDFGISNFLMGMSLGYEVMDILDIGVTCKWLHESLDDHSASAVAFDLGILHQTTNEDLKLGITLQNVGRQLTYYTEDEYEEEMPMIITAGFNYNPLETLFVLLEFYQPLAEDYSLRFGTEYQIHPIFTARIGYKSDADDWKLGGSGDTLSGISAGFGINWDQYKLDYSVASYGDLGLINQISVTYDF